MDLPAKKQLLKHRNSLETTFTKFKHDVDNIIDDTKHIVIDIEEIGDDFKHCYNKCCLNMFLKQNMLFFGVILGIGKLPGPKIKEYVYYTFPFN